MSTRPGVTSSTLFLVALKLGHHFVDALRPGYQEKARRRGWTLRLPPSQDAADPLHLTCPACGQKWHVLPDQNNDFADHMLLCPHGCLREDLKDTRRP